MAWVYILRSEGGRHYIGCTDDLDRRLAEHRRGSCHTTRRLGVDLWLIACSEVESMNEARALERRLKLLKNAMKAIELLGRAK